MSSNKTAKGKNVMTNNQLGVPPNTGFLPLDHAHRAHAVLSASAAKRWLNCPPSARLNEQFPNTSSEYADEGTAAHELCEYKVRKYLHDRMERPHSEYYTEEIEQATDIYAEFVIGIIEEMKANGVEPMALVEEKLDYSHVAPSGFGTGDSRPDGMRQWRLLQCKCEFLRLCSIRQQGHRSRSPEYPACPSW